MRLRITFLALLLALAAPLPAQERDSVMMDLTIGPGGGWGTRYDGAFGLAAEFTIAKRSARHRALLGGITAGVASAMYTADPLICEWSRSTCVAPDRVPDLAHVALLTGVMRGPVRLFAGPAMFGGQGMGIGAQVQADVAGGLSHLAFVAAARASAVRRFDGRHLRLLSAGLGVRLR